MAKTHLLSASRIVDKQNYNKIAITNLTKQNNKDAVVKVAKGFTKEEASDAPPMGPPTGGNPGSDPDVVGTSEDLGASVPAPSD